MTGNSSPAGGRAGAADGVAAAARFSLLPLLPLAIAAKEERCDMEKPKKEKPLGGSSSNGWMGSFWEWCGKINGKINVDGRMAALHFVVLFYIEGKHFGTSRRGIWSWWLVQYCT